MIKDSEAQLLVINTDQLPTAQAEALQQATRKNLHDQQEAQLKRTREVHLNRELSVLFGNYRATLQGAALDLYRNGRSRPNGWTRRSLIGEWQNNRDGLTTNSQIIFTVDSDEVHLKKYQAIFGFQDSWQEQYFPDKKCSNPTLEINSDGTILDPDVLKIRLSGLDSHWYLKFKKIPRNEELLSDFTSELQRHNSGGMPGFKIEGYEFIFPDPDNLAVLGLKAYSALRSEFWGVLKTSFSDGYYDLIRGGFSRWSHKKSLLKCAPEQLVGVLREALNIIPAEPEQY